MSDAGAAGHLGYILAAAFAPDGGRVYYSAAAEAAVYVCDPAAGTPTQRWACHRGPIMELRCPEPGRHLFTAALDGRVHVLDTATGETLRILETGVAGLHSLDVAGHLVAAGSFDGKVHLWDRDGRPRGILEAHADAVTAVAIVSPRHLITGSRDCTLQLWDLERRSSVRTMTGHRAWVTRLAALGDECRVVSAGEDGQCALWDWQRGRRLWHGRIDAPIWSLGLAPDRSFAVTGSRVTRWDLRSGAGQALDAATAERAIAIAPDGRLAALGTDTGDLCLFDLDARRRVRLLASARPDSLALAAAADRGGRRLALGFRDGTVRVRDADGSLTVLPPDHGFMAYALCTLGDSGRFASTGFDGTVRVRRFDGHGAGELLDHGGTYVFSVTASADGRWLLAAGDERWTLWDLESGRRIAAASDPGAGTHCVATLGGDGRILSAGEDGRLRLWRADGTLEASLPHSAGYVCALAARPGQHVAVLGDARGRVSVLDLDTGQCRRLHQAHEDWIRAVHVSPNGRYAVSVSQNFVCCVYDLVEGRLLEDQALRAPIPAAALDAEGRLLAFSATGELLDPMLP